MNNTDFGKWWIICDGLDFPVGIEIPKKSLYVRVRGTTDIISLPIGQSGMLFNKLCENKETNLKLVIPVVVPLDAKTSVDDKNKKLIIHGDGGEEMHIDFKQLPS